MINNEVSNVVRAAIFRSGMNAPASLKLRFTLSLQTDDMGTFTQRGCASYEEALWHINSARAHDKLSPMTLDTLKMLTMSGGSNRATFTPEN